MLEGITAGFIVSLILYPGTVWLIKVGVSGRAGQVLAVGAAFWLSSLFWMCIAAPGMMLMVANLPFIRPVIHLFAAMVLIYIGVQYFRTRKVVRIDDAADLPPARELFRNALVQSIAMPLRLPSAMSILLATGVYNNYPPAADMLPPLLLGIVLGLIAWWGASALCALFFAKRVPPRAILRLLNKIRPVCTMVCLGLAIHVVFLAV